MKNFIACSFVITSLIYTKVNGQDLPPIQLDRPDQTECPFITPTHFIQVESGISYEDLASDEKALSIPSVLWKYGVNKSFELRLITEYASVKNGSISNAGFVPLTFGFKTSLFEERGFIPKTSFIGHISSSKTGASNFRTKYIAPAFRFTMLHSLSEKVSLAYNLGAEWNGEDAQQTYIYTLTTGFTLSEKLGCYTEIFGFFPIADKADHRVDCGLTYLIRDHMMADISAGLGLNHSLLNHYIAIGYSFRFDTR